MRELSAEAAIDNSGNTPFDFVFVGGGISALCLGALLAKDGYRVLVCEQSGRLGGRAFVWQRDGFTFDYGVHVVRFGEHSALASCLRALGQRFDFVPIGRSQLVDVDGRVKLLPTTLAEMLRTPLLSFMEKLAGTRLLASLGQAATLEETSVAEWLRQQRVEGGLRRYLHLVCASMMVCPFLELASAGELLRNMRKVLRSGRSAVYPRHGWKPVQELLTRIIEERGEIRLGAKVERVLCEGRRARGVLVDGSEVSACNVVIAMPLQDLGAVVDEQVVGAEYLARCRALRPTSGVFLDYALDTVVSRDRGWWYFYDPMAFGLFTSNLCPELAPSGKQLFTVFQPTSHEEAADAGRAGALLERLEDTIFARFPGFREHVQFSRRNHLTRIDGVQISTTQTRRHRPGPRLPGVDNVFLTGDTIAAPGVGGDVALEAVLVTYREISGRAP